MESEKMYEIIKKQLEHLATNSDLEGQIKSIKWENGMRTRIILELDVEKDHVIVHGFEFRVRCPNGIIAR